MTTKTSDALLYTIADTLQISLQPMGEGYKGRDTRAIKIGPWVIETEITVKSDVLTPEIATFWVHVKEDLWLYLISHNRGSSINMLAFSGEVAKLKKSMLSIPCEAGNLKRTMQRLRDANAVPFAFKQGKWIAELLPDNL